MSIIYEFLLLLHTESTNGGVAIFINKKLRFTELAISTNLEAVAERANYSHQTYNWAY